MVKRQDVPVLLTVAAVGLGVGVGMWLMRDRIKDAARDAGWKSLRQVRVRVLGQRATITVWRKSGDEYSSV